MYDNSFKFKQDEDLSYFIPFIDNNAAVNVDVQSTLHGGDRGTAFESGMGVVFFE